MIVKELAMKTKDFKAFKEVIADADEKHPIWWAGYLWIDLTAKQGAQAYEILKGRGFEQNATGHVLLPSGLGIKPNA